MSRSDADPLQHPRLSQYARRYRTGWFIIGAAMVFASLVAVALPWPMKVLADFVLGNEKPTGAIAWLISVLPRASSSKYALAIWAALGGLVLFILNALIDVVLTCSWVRFGQAAVYNLAQSIFAA